MKKQNKKSISKLFIFILFLSLFLVQTSDNSLAISKWNYYGGTSRASFVQSTGTSFADDFTVSTQNVNVHSVYSPLVDDLDGDGFNEIIVITATNEIRLFRGIDFDLIDVYFNAELNPSGQFVTTDFLGDGNPELMIITNTDGLLANYSLWAVNWNGTDFNITKEINLTSNEYSNGLSCYGGNCYYFSNSSKLYKYNSSDNTTTSPVYNGTVDEYCYEHSIPIFYDYDLDGDMDIFTIWGGGVWACNHVLQLENNGTAFVLDHEYSLETELGAVNNIAIANLDGGQKELIITQSHVYAHIDTATPYLSTVHYFGLLDHSSICSHSFGLAGNTYVPLITSLHTCYSDEGQGACDYDDDGWDDVWITLNYPSVYRNGSFEVLDEDCNILASINMTSNIVPFAYDNAKYDLEDYVKGVYANMDSDPEFEFVYLFGVWNRDGSLLVEFINHTAPTLTVEGTSYILVADVTGNDTFDVTNDIIFQQVDLTPRITVFSFNYTNLNPYFIGDGPDVDTCVPLCVNETITFYARRGLDYDDVEGNDAVLGVDCYDLGRDNITWGSLAEDPEVSCTYDILGSWDVDIYITDESNYPSYGESVTIGIYTSLGSSCYESGEWEEGCSPFVYDPPEPVERCFTDSAISVCLVKGTSPFLCDICGCYNLSFTLCPAYDEYGVVIDGYDDKLFNWNQCESWQGSLWYGACPFYIWGISGLSSIWDFIFSAFWIFLTLLLVIVVMAIIIKKKGFVGK